MSEDSNSNSCAYCLKPVVDSFICADCMAEKNVSVERLGVPSEETVAQHAVAKKQKINHQAAKAIAGTRPEKVPTTKTKIGAHALKEWKKFPLHSDFDGIGSRAKLATFGLLIPVGVVGFGVSTMFGFPVVLALCIAVGLAIGWILFRAEQNLWYRYASWIFVNGQSIECEVDLVSSGELDQPYIVLRDENRLSLVYDTRAFKVVQGDSKEIMQERNAPGAKSTFRCIAHFEKQLDENAVIFEVDDKRLWCRANFSRGF